MRNRFVLRGPVWILSSVALSSLVDANVGFAQSGAPEAHADGIEEITVTARRLEENLQTVPVAVAAFSADQLSQRSIRNLGDLSGVAPNFYVLSGPSGGQSTADFYIRGVGQIDYLPTAEPGVSVYVDGVYLSGITGAVLDLADIERVEVLRGPQGTLFGRNSIGGAINITSRPPGESLGGEVELGAGNRDRFEVKGHIDVPLDDDRAGFSISGIRRVQEGFGHRLGSGEQMGDTNLQGGRATFRFKPVDNVSLLLSVDGTRRREHAAVQSPIDIVEQDSTYLALLGVGYATVSPTCPGSQCTSPFLNKGPYQSFATGPNISDLDVWGSSMNLAWEMGSVTLKSITAYRNQGSRSGYDADGSPIVVFQQLVDVRSHQISQELQLLGQMDRFNWILGGYYFDGTAITHYDVLGLGGGLVDGIDDTLDTLSLAGFGSLTYSVTDRLKLTGGLRYSWDRKTVTDGDDLILGGIPLSAYRNPVGGLQPYGYIAHERKSWDNVSPKGSVEFQATPDAFLYGSVSRGYKSGSFNVRPNSNVTEPLSFEPEKVTSYEIGGKFDLLDRHLRLNTALFRTDYEDIQQLIIIPDALLGVTGPTVNVGKARQQGAELEIVARPVRALTLTANAGYLDAKFTKLNPPASFPGAIVPFGTNTQVPGSPKWTTAVGAQYEVPITDDLSLALRSDVNYRARIYFALPNLPGEDQAGLTLVNVRATLETKSGWRLALWGTNVTNRVYKNYALSQFGILNADFSNPAEYGATLAKRF